MNNGERETLHKELRSAGASSVEISELLGVAANLSRLKSANRQPARRRSKSRGRLFAYGLTAVSGLAVGIFLVIFSQTVLPGNLLYPVQKMSDRVAIAIDPSYRGKVMMSRAEQVQRLVSRRAPSDLVLATLADYQRQAASYKSVKANYAAFEFCKNSLEQAAATAPATERQAINNTLQSLQNV